MEIDAPSIKGRDTFKPFRYPWAFELAQKHENMHWTPTEISLNEDVIDWEKNLSSNEKDLLTNLFRFFTQADVDVLQGYAGKLLPLFWKTPELSAIFGSIAAREMVHVWAYSLLLETVGLDDSEYSKFLEIEEMAKKDEYVTSFNCDTPENTAKTLAVYGAFTEGIQLFSSFAILMNFPRHKKMKGMGKIVEWSIRDEDIHVEACVRMYHEWMKENPKINKEQMDKELLEICLKMVELEDAFIDLAFKSNEIAGLTPNEVKQYIRSIADVRLGQLGLKPYYNVKNPLTWLDWILYGEDQTNFFENRSTEYGKGSLIDDTAEMNW